MIEQIARMSVDAEYAWEVYFEGGAQDVDLISDDILPAFRQLAA